MSPVISAVSLGKAYKQYNHKWARLAEWLDPARKPRHRLRWVLQEVTFDVGPGEAVGIIGVNGAGKSTLLKMIAGTASPTTGTVAVHGRVGALLELGMGFHGDFTGRQNVYMAGQLLGYRYDELQQLMPEIEDFAEIGEYIDQPTRVYSSGMQVRLAFGVATARRPEVLIVDEALAVGDASFQRKCHRKIESFIEQGTSLLFVSHDIEGIKKICNKALYLSEGRVKAYGEAKPVCDEYENHLFGANKVVRGSGPLALPPEGSADAGNLIDPALLGVREASYGNGQANIGEIWLENATGLKTNVITSGAEFSVCYEVSLTPEARFPVVAMLIKTLEGIALYGTDSVSLGERLSTTDLGDRWRVRFEMQCHLAAGVYFLNCGIRNGLDAGVFYHRRVDALMFQVRKTSDAGQAGLVNLNARLNVESAR